MTKRQAVAACVAIAPDFSMRFERVGDLGYVAASYTVDGTPMAIRMQIGPLGRAAVESRVLEAALSRLRPRKVA